MCFSFYILFSFDFFPLFLFFCIFSFPSLLSFFGAPFLSLFFSPFPCFFLFRPSFLAPLLDTPGCKRTLCTPQDTPLDSAATTTRAKVGTQRGCRVSLIYQSSCNKTILSVLFIKICFSTYVQRYGCFKHVSLTPRFKIVANSYRMSLIMIPSKEYNL